MSDLTVRIVELPPMRVACAHGFGASPEDVASAKIEAFVEANGLADYQQFGFNNPNPSPGSPNYGYDIWVTVGPEIQGTGDITIKDFEGGLYAVTRFKGLQHIGAVWQSMVNWCEESPYRMAHHQWLESLQPPRAVPVEDFVFDIYLPIAK